MFTHFRRRISATLVSMIILTAMFSTLFTAILPTFAGSNSTENLPVSAYQSLDGMLFEGPFKVEGETDPRTEVFTFNKGRFFADGCLEWGFKPAPYWIRKSANGTHFLAVLESPEHGTMRYEGIFDGNKLEASAFWKKERWYWTIERTYSFKGQPAGILE